MKDIDCPYCGHGIDIDHDDGQGYAEDQLHQQSCPNCNKEFVFTTTVSFNYSARKADCLNGEPHDFKKTNTYPPQFARMRCKSCGHETPIDNAERTT